MNEHLLHFLTNKGTAYEAQKVKILLYGIREIKTIIASKLLNNESLNTYNRKMNRI